jgi:AcrR family transcriptional regulator
VYFVDVKLSGFATLSRQALSAPSPDDASTGDHAPGAPAPQRYHHGDLASALLDAGEAELADKGIEAFSLRGVAKRAGVSHAAPAHHFRDVNGLLTAIAARGFERFVARQEDFRRQAPDTPRARLVASGVGYVVFAQEHPALFRLMFGSSRPDFADAGLGSAAAAAHADLARHVAAITGRDPAAQPDPQAMADVACVWALAHGLADLLVAGRLAAVAALPAQRRLETIAALLGRIVPAGEAPTAGSKDKGLADGAGV